MTPLVGWNRIAGGECDVPIAALDDDAVRLNRDHPPTADLLAHPDWLGVDHGQRMFCISGAGFKLA